MPITLKENASGLNPLVTTILAVVPAILVGAALFALLGTDPLKAYRVMAVGAFGSWFDFSEVLVKAIPLMLTGLSVAVAARMQLWNIGAEGQLVFGGILAAGVALFWAGRLPPALVLPALVAAGFAGGALWALVPAILKARWNVNEIITTLMFNYVAIIFMEHLYFGPWRDPRGMGFPGTAMFKQVAWLPRFLHTRIHLGLFVALAAAALLYAALEYTPWGYRVRVIGLSDRAAHYAGFAFSRQQILVMLLSGGLAGLAGMGEVCGIHLRLQQGLAVGYGYDGIIIAFLARLNPAAVPVAAVLLAGLIVGGDQLQSATHLPSSISMVLEGVLLLAVLGASFFNRYRIRITAGNRK